MDYEDPRTRVEVLRLGHRPERDKRITTHVALVARAFGASSIHVDTRDPHLEKTVNALKDRFGGDFTIRTGVSRKSVLGKWRGTVIHLTMYGSNLDDIIDEVPLDEDILVIVGAEKVPRDVYDLAHFNIAVGNQPHSEVSALALFLDRYYKGKELKGEMKGGQFSIVPSNVGKVVIGPGSTIDPLLSGDPFKKCWPKVPDEELSIEILSMLGASRSIIGHVKEVLRLGMDMVNRSMEIENGKVLVIDQPLLKAGLILHDLGRTRTHSIRHVTKGVELARRLGLDERIQRIIHNHPGAGIPQGEAIDLGLPDEDHIPITLEEKIVCHSDNLVGSSRRRPLSVPIKKLKEKGADLAAVRMEYLHKELEGILGIDIDELLPEE